MAVYAYVGGTGPTLDLNFVNQTYQRSNTPVTYTTPSWRQVQSIYVRTGGAWVKTTGSWAGYGQTYKAVMAGINYTALSLGLQQAYINPSSAAGILFNRVYNGRLVGDINNDGLLTLNDVLDTVKFSIGKPVAAASEDYLRNQLLGIFQFYAPDYNAYMY